MKNATFAFSLTRIITGLAAAACFLSFNPGTISALPYPGRSPANKLTSSDTVDSDQLGYSVAISDRFAIAGAIHENGGGSDRGAAFVYDVKSGVELLKLTASDAEDDDEFGHSVSVFGHLAVVGARWEDGAGLNYGAAYVFDLNTGEERFKLTASDADESDDFGYAVAISGNLIIIGAIGENGAGAGNANRGAAYVFDLTDPNVPNPAFPDQLNENRKLTASDTADGDLYGRSVAIAGELAVVGAIWNDGGGTNTGAAYVYDLSTGDELFRLTASDAEDEDSLGHGVAIENNLVVVGAHGEDGDGIGDVLRGAAYVYNLDNPVIPDPAMPTILHENRKLTASDTEDGDRFGYKVGISGDHAVIAARDEDGDGGSNRGAAYVFDLTHGKELIKLTAADAEDGDRLGWSVAIWNQTVVAGAPTEDGAGSNRGAAYVFEFSIQQPDNRIGPKPFSSLGDDIYNTDAAGQTFNLTSKKLRKLKAWLTVQNDGDAADDYLLAGTSGNRFFTVSYFRRIANRRINVTGAMTAETYEETNVVPGEPGRLISIEISPSRKLQKRKKNGKKTILRKRFTVTLTTESKQFDFKRDTAAIQAMTR